MARAIERMMDRAEKACIVVACLKMRDEMKRQKKEKIEKMGNEDIIFWNLGIYTFSRWRSSIELRVRFQAIPRRGRMHSSNRIYRRMK